jgi:hypothetical protein
MVYQKRFRLPRIMQILILKLQSADKITHTKVELLCFVPNTLITSSNMAFGFKNLQISP